jgi:starvation-inducible DNA-binding protein
MQAARNASFERTRQQSLDLLNRHLAAAVILQDRMRRSPRNLKGANFIMIDDMCDQVASLMETCTMLIADRLHDLGGKVLWPVLLDEFVSVQGARCQSTAGQIVTGLSDAEPLDAFGQSVLDAVAVAEAYGDTATAGVMEQIWRDVDRQLWSVDVQKDRRQ